MKVFPRSGFLALDSVEDFPSSVRAGITDLLVFKERDLSGLFILLSFFYGFLSGISNLLLDILGHLRHHTRHNVGVMIHSAYHAFLGIHAQGDHHGYDY